MVSEEAWFIKHNKRTLGPFTIATLRDQILRQRIDRTTLASHTPKGPWKPLHLHPPLKHICERQTAQGLPPSRQADRIASSKYTGRKASSKPIYMLIGIGAAACMFLLSLVVLSSISESGPQLEGPASSRPPDAVSSDQDGELKSNGTTRPGPIKDASAAAPDAQLPEIATVDGPNASPPGTNTELPGTNPEPADANAEQPSTDPQSGNASAGAGPAGSALPETPNVAQELSSQQVEELAAIDALEQMHKQLLGERATTAEAQKEIETLLKQSRRTVSNSPEVFSCAVAVQLDFGIKPGKQPRVRSSRSANYWMGHRVKVVASMMFLGSTYALGQLKQYQDAVLAAARRIDDPGDRQRLAAEFRWISDSAVLLGVLSSRDRVLIERITSNAVASTYLTDVSAADEDDEGASASSKADACERRLRNVLSTAKTISAAAKRKFDARKVAQMGPLERDAIMAVREYVDAYSDLRLAETVLESDGTLAKIRGITEFKVERMRRDVRALYQLYLSKRDKYGELYGQCMQAYLGAMQLIRGNQAAVLRIKSGDEDVLKREPDLVSLTKSIDRVLITEQQSVQRALLPVLQNTLLSVRSAKADKELIVTRLIAKQLQINVVSVFAGARESIRRGGVSD